MLLSSASYTYTTILHTLMVIDIISIVYTVVYPGHGCHINGILLCYNRRSYQSKRTSSYNQDTFEDLGLQTDKTPVSADCGEHMDQNDQGPTSN